MAGCGDNNLHNYFSNLTKTSSSDNVPILGKTNMVSKQDTFQIDPAWPQFLKDLVAASHAKDPSVVVSKHGDPVITLLVGQGEDMYGTQSPKRSAIESVRSLFEDYWIYYFEISKAQEPPIDIDETYAAMYLTKNAEEEDVEVNVWFYMSGGLLVQIHIYWYAVFINRKD